MGIKEGDRVFIEGATPESLTAIDLPSVNLAVRLTGKLDHIVVFVTSRVDLEAHFSDLRKHLAPAGKLWVTWPKKGRLETDLDLKNVICVGYEHGLVESTNLRIDETWTSLKFTWPKQGKTYHNKYGTLRLWQ